MPDLYTDHASATAAMNALDFAECDDARRLLALPPAEDNQDCRECPAQVACGMESA